MRVEDMLVLALYVFNKLSMGILEIVIVSSL